MSTVLFRISLGGWGLAVVVCVLALTHYSNAPGKAAIAPGSWPAQSTLNLAEDGITMLVLLHPQCSCSRSTLAELERIVAQVGARANVQLIFFASSQMDSNWVEDDLWQIAGRIPGVTLVKDIDGLITRQFGTFTSGQTLLYDSTGALLFKGGITPARGHEGDNVGKEAVLSILGKNTNDTEESLVFGCSILGDAR